MVRCSEDNIKFIDQLQLQAISSIWYFFSRWIYYYSTFALFLSRWIEIEKEKVLFIEEQLW